MSVKGRWDIDEIRSELDVMPAVDPVLGPLMERLELRPAAVLLPLLRREGDWHVLFTRRSQRVTAHKGQISFPGGRVDDTDESEEYAARRETYEEIGVPHESIEILGKLPDSLSIAGFRMAPYVGMLPSSLSFVPNEYEIEEIFDVPIRALLEPGVLRKTMRVHVGERHIHHVFSFDWREGYEIWGATARILKTFLEQLAGPLKVVEGEVKRVEMSFPFEKK